MNYIVWYVSSHSSTADLHPPMMNVTSNGSSTAGEVFSLECVVMTVEGVRLDDISIMWTGPDGSIPSGDHIEIENVTITESGLPPTGSGEDTDMPTLTTADSVAVGRLVFSPLHTSDRGEYSCTGRISVDSVGVDVSDSDSMDVNVTSKPLDVHSLLASLSTVFINHTCVLFTFSCSPSTRRVSLSQHRRHSVPGNRAGHHMYCYSRLCCEYWV